MKIFAIVTLAFAPMLLSAQTLDESSAAVRREAAGWAAAHRLEAFDSAIPSAADEDIRSPLCRVTTIRVSGSIDRLEYAIRIAEDCPSVGPDDRVHEGAVQGEFIIADQHPLTVQLAKQRVASPGVKFDGALSAVRVRRVPLTDARQILREILRMRPAPVPASEIALDEPVYELASATGVVRRVIEVAAAHDRGERSLMALAQRVAARFGYSDEKLRYDASSWD